MNNLIVFHKQGKELKDKIYEHCGINVSECYQCGTCSGVCPLNEEMEIPPNRLIRMLQVNLPTIEDRVLRSYTIWLCLTCEYCYTLCPRQINIPGVMNYLREESRRQKKINPKARNIITFYKTFLDSIKQTGRLYELGLIGMYKIRTLNFLQDIKLAPKMFAKSKLSLFPHSIKEKKSFSKIFKKLL